MKFHNIFLLFACFMLISCTETCSGDEFVYITVTNTQSESVHFTNDPRQDRTKQSFVQLEPNHSFVFKRYDEDLKNPGITLYILFSKKLEKFGLSEFVVDEVCDTIIFVKYDDIVKSNYMINI